MMESKIGPDIRFRKVMDTFCCGLDGKKTNDRIVCLRSEDADYWIRIIFYECGYIHLNVSANSDKVPCIFIHDDDSTASYAYADLPSLRIKAENIDAMVAALQRLQTNLEAINNIIQEVNAGERFQE